MSKPVIHLCAPGSPGREISKALGLDGAPALIRLVQEVVGRGYRAGGRPSLIDVIIDDKRGGRRDDAARVRELEHALGRDEVAAVIALRGGGWLTRILADVDFSVLDRRSRPVAVFGFSEITPLVNIVGAHRMGRGYYYMTPGFPGIAMARYARLNLTRLARGRKPTGRAAERFAERWARVRFESAFADYFRQVVDILEGRGPSRKITGTLVSGKLPPVSRATIMGGCISLATTLTTGAFGSRVDPRGKWIALEDLGETPYRLDRQLAHLKLARWFEMCAGVLLGDFHLGAREQTDEVLGMIKYHLPAGRKLPVVVSKDFGHTWPQAVLPLGKRVTLRCTRRERQRPRVELEAPWLRWRVCGGAR